MKDMYYSNSAPEWLIRMLARMEVSIEKGLPVFTYKKIDLKHDFPKEFDFFKEWCGQDPINGREYYERMHLL